MGVTGITALSNGNYVVRSKAWTGGTTNGFGAVTWGSGVTGVSGVVSSANSLVGSHNGDLLGANAIVTTANGGFIVRSATYNSGVGLVELFQDNSTPSKLYANTPATDVTINTAAITAITNTGTSVTLQANNDLTLSSTSNITTSHGGSGGAITLDAGRSITLNSNITTDNGALTLLANDTAANGVVDADRAAGAAAITMANGTSLNAGTGTVSITLSNGAGLTNSTSGDITLNNVTGGSMIVQNVQNTGDIILNGTLTASGTGTPITLASDRNFINNTGSGALSASSGQWLIYSTNPASNTLDSLTANFDRYTCTYGGSCPSFPSTTNGLLYSYTPTLTVTPNAISSIIYGSAVPTLTNYSYTLGSYLVGELSTDTIGGGPLNGSTNYTQGSGVGTYNISNSSGTLTSALGYGFSYATNNSAFTVTAKTISESGLSVPGSMTYNDTTTAVVSGTPALLSAEASGAGNTSDDKPYTGDTVSITGTPTGTYNTKDVATATTVTFAGLSLTGAQAGDYTLSIQAPQAATITAKTISESGLSVPASMTYNDTTTAVVSGSASLLSAEAAGAGNTSDDKPYTGDTVSITGTPTGTYNFKDVATATTVTFGGLSLTGGQAGDYTLAMQGTQAATITPKTISESGLSVPGSKTYDDTTTAVVSGTPSLLASEASGAGSTADDKPYTGDTVSITGTPTGTYNFKDVATATTVTFGGLSLTGAQAGDYTLSIQGTQAATITPKTISESGLSVPASMTYNDTTTAVVSGTASLLSSEASGAGNTSDDKPYTGDTVSITGTATGTYNFKDVATATTVTFAGLSLTGGQASDYSLATATQAATITKAPLTVTAVGQDIAYGTTVPATTVSYSGFVSSESAANLATAPTASSGLSGIQSAGTYIGNYTASGGVSGNYNFTYDAGTLTVDAALLTTATANDIPDTVISAMTQGNGSLAPVSGEDFSFPASNEPDHSSKKKENHALFEITPELVKQLEIAPELVKRLALDEDLTMAQ